MYIKLDKSFYDYQMVKVDSHVAISFTEASSIKNIRLSDGILENVAANACGSCNCYLSSYRFKENTNKILNVLEKFINEDISKLKEIVDTNPQIQIKLYEALDKCPGFDWAKDKKVELECLKKIKIEKVRDIDFPELKWYICPFERTTYIRKDEYYSLLFPNVSSSGEVCWGDVNTLDSMVSSKKIDLSTLVISFWNSNFNFDYIRGLSPKIYIDEFGADWTNYYHNYGDYRNARDFKSGLGCLELYKVLPLLPDLDNEENESYIDIYNESPIEKDTIGIYIDKNSRIIYEIKAEDDSFYYGHIHQYDDGKDGEDDELVFVKIKKS